MTHLNICSRNDSLSLVQGHAVRSSDREKKDRQNSPVYVTLPCCTLRLEKAWRAVILASNTSAWPPSQYLIFDSEYYTELLDIYKATNAMAMAGIENC